MHAAVTAGTYSVHLRLCNEETGNLWRPYSVYSDSGREKNKIKTSSIFAYKNPPKTCERVSLNFKETDKLYNAPTEMIDHGTQRHVRLPLERTSKRSAVKKKRPFVGGASPQKGNVGEQKLSHKGSTY